MAPQSQPKNDRLLRALRREAVDCTPVWLMRQAGRYLPEYRLVREQAGSFMKLCTTPDLACEVTLQPLQRFDLDAAILFSDILTIPDAMGLGLEFREGEGPVFRRPVRSSADIDRLGVPDPEQDLGYVLNAARNVRRELGGRIPLIGFSGSPWTLATYAVEGGSSTTFSRVKGLMYSDIRRMHQLLGILTTAVTSYLDAQVCAGAQALMLFDTWGGVLTPERYQECSLEYMRTIVSALRQSHADVPIIVFTKGGGAWAKSIADIGCHAVGLDWTVRLADTRLMVQDKVALQGNLDPTVLYAPATTIEQEVAKVLADYGHGPGHIFNLGHGIQPETPPASVGVLVDSVHRLSLVDQSSS